MAVILNKKTPAEISNTERYPVAAIREGVVFPHTEMVLTFGRTQSTLAVNEAYANGGQIIFVTQKKVTTSEPKKEDIYQIGVLAKIDRTLKTNGEINALVHGLERVKLVDVDDSHAYLTSGMETLSDVEEDDPELEALSKHIVNEFKKAVNLGKNVEFMSFMKLMAGVNASELADQVSMSLDIPTPKKQDLLETLSVKDRLIKVISHLSHEVQVLDIERNIATKTQKKFDKNMRENILRERMQTIQKELGETSDEEQDVKDFKKKIAQLNLDKEVKTKIIKELNRFSHLSVHSPEYSYIRAWLETVVDLPWSTSNSNDVSFKKAEQILNKDHYGLDDVKERITEYLAVMQLKKAINKPKEKRVPTILCFVGPPGVGKTSIGKSIAKALGRKFVKVSLGGIRDEAEIRGHRRTYVGAMPGRIIQGIRDAGTKNPVFMLDEIDKVGNDFRGDPTSALLEALDPEQNHAFSDHYIELPFDLSQVIFITTANVLDTIPPALRDRLEIIEYTGYTDDEKYQIARKHLIDKSLKNNGLKGSQYILSTQALKDIIHTYTREAGVRSLEREINKTMRKVAKEIATEKAKKVEITQKNLSTYLGPQRYSDTLREKKDEIGLATGLAWTQVGGDILFIEVALMPGKGNVVLTGKLGEVMQESAKAAWSYVRSKWELLKLDKNFYKNLDVHIHVPEGAVPKDGPSAGITITTAIVSALTKKPVRKEVAMTGEITLRGRVLEIGGLKEKVIAAHRAGLKVIIVPKNNKKDLVKIPAAVKKDLSFHFVNTIDQVLKIALV